MRGRVAAALLLCAVAGVWWYLHPTRTPATPNAESPATKINYQPAPTGVAPEPTPGETSINAVATAPTATASEPAPVAAAVVSQKTDSNVPAPPGLPPATVLENMRMAVREYGSRFAGNPVGTNPEITQALNGGNPKQIKFISPEAGLQINGRGELVDPWGTPYFFHQLSAIEMEIRSAGPDKKMWTDDDLVIK